MSQTAAFFFGMGVGLVSGLAGAWFWGVQKAIAWHLGNPPAPPGYPSWNDFKNRRRDRDFAEFIEAEQCGVGRPSPPESSYEYLVKSPTRFAPAWRSREGGGQRK